MSQKKTFNILSIDGGGIRGIIPAMILERLEEETGIAKKTGKNISCLFDLIVGTSTGGILALGLTQGGTREKPLLSAEELVKIYAKRGSKIFNLSGSAKTLSTVEEKFKERLEPLEKSESPTIMQILKLIDLISELGRLTDEKYSRDGLEEVFDCFVDETLCLKNVITKTMVTCYDMQAPEPLFLKSWKCEHKDIRIRDAAFATSAAPTFFEPLPLCYAGTDRTLIDGGIFINSPVVSAYAEGQKLIHGSEEYKDIFVASLGTGKFTSITKHKEAKNWGAGSWLIALLDYISHSGPAAADYQMEQFFADNPDNYVRLQEKLDENHDQMDDASDKNICYLKKRAETMMKSCEFKKLCEHLKKRADEVCE